ncbi:MAG: hypothetical protein A3J28_06735 [Acidobacteria bacterium RIFCSPLOWO2_12_FULL_60_22]|nr:MAG: hypothetical protein A3J28_06735 [Acidobacteria bacterium RIFCSPLOWO2_12_FULL_60_22]
MISKRLCPKAIRFGVVLASFYLGLAGPGLLLAQVTTATISGTTKDQTEAVVPGAKVTVTNKETGTVRTSVTGSTGRYRLTALPIGTYDVEVELAGFQRGVRSGVVLNVGQEMVVDFNLQVGDVAEQVTVTGDVPLIETTTSTISGLVEPKQMRDIPLNSRSFLELVPLQTGAVFQEAGDSTASKGFGKKLSIVGARAASNSFLLDGADINDSTNSAGSAAGTMAGVETVREFRVVTNAYDAEYGRHTGGVISAITKSGTNEFHGSLFEFLRNDNLDARNFFDRDPRNPTVRSNPPEFRRNQFGFSAGGPVIRNRTFFFGSYEGLREGLGQTFTFNVPGVQMRRGILAGQTINVDPKVRPFLEAYPFPNTPDRPDGTAQFIEGLTNTTSQNFWTARVDHRFSDSDSIFGRFTFDGAQQFRPGQIGRELTVNTGGDANTANRFLTLEETHLFSAALLSRTHFSYNRTRLSLFDIALEGRTYPKFSFTSQDDVSGSIAVSGLNNWGGDAFNPKLYIQNTFQFKQDFFYTVGRHSLKWGGQGERFQFNQRTDFNAGGAFTFGSLADFLRNDSSGATFTKPGSDNIRGWRQSLFGLYLQDDIAVLPGFSLNIGVRYEFITVPTEANGKVATIRDLTPRHFYSVTDAQTDIGDPYFLNPSLKNFAPRVGLAWDPFRNGKTSVRAGVGVYDEQVLPYLYSVTGARIAPFYSVAQLLPPAIQPDFPDAFFSQRASIEAGIGGSKPQADGVEWNITQPKAYKWSMDIQQQVAPGTTAEIGYSGTRGTHLYRVMMLNATQSEMRDGRRFYLADRPLFNNNWNRMRWRLFDAVSDYHGLRVSVNKRFSRGLQFQSSYTFSKSTDDFSSWIGSDLGAADRAGYMTEHFHGLSGFDVRNSFYTNFVYDLPGAQWTGAAGKLLGGWSLSGILRLNSGHPITLLADQPRQGANRLQFVEGSTLDLAPGADQSPTRPRNPNQYFDPSSFLFPTPFFAGNLGRNHLIVPGIANFDITLIKSTPLPVLGEAGSLQFRAEFFNLFNRANFGIPAFNLFDQTGRPRSNAGEITETRTTSRQIQLALRLVF